MQSSPNFSGRSRMGGEVVTPFCDGLPFALAPRPHPRLRLARNGMLAVLLTASTAAAGRAEPASPRATAGSLEPMLPEDPIQHLDPKGAYAVLGAGASWPQPVHYRDDRLGPLLPIRGEVLANPGFASELGLGYDFGRLRGELTSVHRQATIDAASSRWSVGPYPAAMLGADNARVTSNSGLASLYLDLPVAGTRWVPYLGGGVGFTALEARTTTIRLGRLESSFGGSGNLLAYQAKAGLAYRSSPRNDLFAEGVFQGAPSRTLGTLERSALINWGLRLGVRWRFGGGLQVAHAPGGMP